MVLIYLMFEVLKQYFQFKTNIQLQVLHYKHLPSITFSFPVDLNNNVKDYGNSLKCYSSDKKHSLKDLFSFVMLKELSKRQQKYYQCLRKEKFEHDRLYRNFNVLERQMPFLFVLIGSNHIQFVNNDTLEGAYKSISIDIAYNKYVTKNIGFSLAGHQSNLKDPSSPFMTIDFSHSNLLFNQQYDYLDQIEMLRRLFLMSMSLHSEKDMIKVILLILLVGHVYLY